MTGYELKRSSCWLALALLGFACGRREHEATPAHTVQPAPEPAPAAAAEPAAPAEAKAAEPPPTAAPAEPAPATDATDTPRAVAQRPSAPQPSASKPAATASKPAVSASKPAVSASKPAVSANKPAKPRATTPAREPERAEAPAPSHPEPEPPAPAPAPVAAPVAKPATRVVIPNTDRVRVEVPAGLQAWLDKDPRMQPWLGKVMKVIDACYADVLAGNPGASGTISFRITMHQNARPDPDIQSLPGALSGVVACATGQLMRTRMPLFTGTEGEQYVVRVRFGS